ncbi:ribbon-helix-helix domain-containing protein [Salmonella enterica]|nr:ribbon-helix-helix domain-containing protein [Salmonella enterica]EJC3639263.1 ribbon-helix-helix domain-containing protein [Salmonella enterica]
MAEPFLKNRRRFTSSLDNHLVPLFGELAEAISDLLLKHGVSPINKGDKNDN